MRNDLSDMIITRIISIVSGYYNAGVTMSRKSRPCCALVHKYEGKTVYRSGEKSYVSDPKSAVLLPEGCDYLWECEQSGHYVTVEFECESNISEIMRFEPVDSARLLQAFKRAELATGLRRMSEVYGIFAYLCEKTASYVPSGKAAVLSPAIAAINEAPHSDLQSKKLAEMCGISDVYFRKLFSEVYGMPLGKYIRKLKFERAKALLSADYGSIADVAVSLGYSDVFSFSKAFRKWTGTTPAKFVKSCLPET